MQLKTRVEFSHYHNESHYIFIVPSVEKIRSNDLKLIECPIFFADKLIDQNNRSFKDLSLIQIQAEMAKQFQLVGYLKLNF